MKKIYINPTLEEMKIAPATLIAESLPKSDDPVNPEDFEVKEQRRDVSNVWDDDWSR